MKKSGNLIKKLLVLISVLLVVFLVVELVSLSILNSLRKGSNLEGELATYSPTVPAISTTAPYDSLVGYWAFDGDLENTQLTKHYDWSKYNNDGTGVGNVIVNNTNCIYGDCARFDGNGDYVNCGNGSSLAPPREVTVSTWVKPKEVKLINKFILSKRASYFLDAMRSGSGADKPHFYVYNSSGKFTTAVSSTKLTANEWNHVVGTYNGTYARVYVNGVLTGTSGIFTTGIAITNYPVRIGINEWGTLDTSFNGSIDDVMIFNTSLTAAQILAIYNNQSAIFMPTGTQDIINQLYTATLSKINITRKITGNNVVLSILKYMPLNESEILMIAEELPAGSSINSSSISPTYKDGNILVWLFSSLIGEEDKNITIASPANTSLTSLTFFTGETSDGYIQSGNSNTYSYARSASGSYSNSASTIYVGQRYVPSPGYYNVYKGYLDFDTSSIPDTATVADVKLSLKVWSDNSDTDFNVKIYKFNWQEPLGGTYQEANYDAIGAVYDADWANTASISFGVYYNSSSLSTSWVNLTGNTKYQLRSNREVDALEPTGSEYIDLYAAEYTGGKPILYVTYVTDSTLPNVTIISPAISSNPEGYLGNFNLNIIPNSINYTVSGTSVSGIKGKWALKNANESGVIN